MQVWGRGGRRHSEQDRSSTATEGKAGDSHGTGSWGERETASPGNHLLAAPLFSVKQEARSRMKETQWEVKERERRDLVDQDSRRPNGRGRDRALPGSAKAVTLMTNLNTDPSATLRRDRQLPARPVSKTVSFPQAWLSYLSVGTAPSKLALTRARDVPEKPEAK